LERSVFRWPWDPKTNAETTGKPDPATSPVLANRPPLKKISQKTIAVMISLFNHLFHEPRPFRALGPLLSIEKFRNILFAMGLSREFLDQCEYTYNWQFQSLLPALNDGSFFTDGARSGASSSKESGQAMLRGFATVLSGILVEHPELRSSESNYFERSLIEDGLQFVGNTLVDTNQDIIPEAAEISAVESLIRLSIHGNKALLLHHFVNGSQLFNSGHYHASVSEWRSFLEETLRGIWRLTRAHRSDFTTYAENPNMKDLFSFLSKAGFFGTDEQLAFSSTWAFLCSGGHPGISEMDDAHLSMILALTFGHAALLKLQNWSKGAFTHF
jgi:hypothetical protein